MPTILRLRSWLLTTVLLWMAVNNGVMLWNTRVEILQGYGDFASFYTAGTRYAGDWAPNSTIPTLSGKCSGNSLPK